MISHVKLEVSKRTVANKKVGQLRKQNIIPGVIFGKGFESLPVQVNAKEFELVYKKIHGTSMLDLTVDGSAMKVLIHSLQRDHITRRIKHIDFHKVDLKEKVSVEVPLFLVGTSPLEGDGIGIVNQQTMSLHIKCLPNDIPAEITVDRALISSDEGAIHVSDIKLPNGVALASEADKDRLVASFMASRVMEAKKEEAGEGTPESAAE